MPQQCPFRIEITATTPTGVSATAVEAGSIEEAFEKAAHLLSAMRFNERKLHQPAEGPSPARKRGRPRKVQAAQSGQPDLLDTTHTARETQITPSATSKALAHPEPGPAGTGFTTPGADTTESAPPGLVSEPTPAQSDQAAASTANNPRGTTNEVSLSSSAADARPDAQDPGTNDPGTAATNNEDDSPLNEIPSCLRRPQSGKSPHAKPQSTTRTTMPAIGADAGNRPDDGAHGKNNDAARPSPLDITIANLEQQIPLATDQPTLSAIREIHKPYLDQLERVDPSRHAQLIFKIDAALGALPQAQ